MEHKMKCTNEECILNTNGEGGIYYVELVREWCGTPQMGATVYEFGADGGECPECYDEG